MAPIKKTILLTIGRSMVARNLLQNDFYRQLRDCYQLVILTPAARDALFLREFSYPGVRFEWFAEESHTKADIFFLGVHKYLIWSKFIALKLRHGIRGLTNPKDLSSARYWLFALIFIPASKLVFLRDFVRWLDFNFGQRKMVADFRALIRREHPTLIISTSISSNGEAALIKAGRREGVMTIGMPKSWDNLSRAGFRVKADILVVWSQFMADQAIKLQRYRPEQVKIIGIPQFDCYQNQQFIWSRERFGREYGIDPAKPIILFTSEGKAIPEDADIALTLAEAIARRELPEAMLLIRPHFSYPDDEKKFSALAGRSFVVIDRANNPSVGFKDTGDFSLTALERFANSLAHAAVVINVASTITLDAVAFDKPVVNVAFEPGLTIPASTQPLSLSYESDYFLEIVKTGGSRVARSRTEFLTAIREYLAEPERDRAGRERLRKRFVGPLDGQAGQRFAALVTQTIETNRL